MVSDKDVVNGILGASSGLAGLTLVFLGLVVSAHESFAGGTGKRFLEPFRKAAKVVLAAFFAGIGCVALATAWLVTDGCYEALYVATIAIFAVELVLLCVATVWTLRRVMWK